MAKPQEKPNPAGLIAIANPKLAKKLNDDASEKLDKPENSISDEKSSLITTLNQDLWKAVLTLNLFRYGFALVLLGLSVLPEINPKLNFFESVIHPDAIRYCAIALLASAATFTFFTKTKQYPLSIILIAQLTFDILLSGVLVHATGSIGSNFTLVFLVVVTTGSVVLRRKHALALASGAVIILFYEHFYSFLKSDAIIEPRIGLLVTFSLLLMGAAWSISQFAKRLRLAEMKSYIPGEESIEEFLVREEKAALKSALESTEGNKTEAAKLLGMTFRSFRYKLTKYDIG